MKKLIGIVGGGVVFFALEVYPYKVYANTFTASLAEEPAVVMDAPQAEIKFRVTHTGTTRPIYRVRFYFNVSTYCPSLASQGPDGWVADWYVCSAAVSGIQFTTSTSPINPGESKEFTVILQGPGYVKIPRASQDITDSTTRIMAYDINGLTLTYQGSQPSWVRHGLMAQTFVIPQSVGAGGEIILSLWVKNTSTATQNLIVPSPPNIYGDGSAVLNYGPSPSSLTLSPLEEGIFEWRFNATSLGEVWFDGYASNGIVSTVNRAYLLSSRVIIGDFVCSLSIKPESLGNGITFTVSMSIFNNSPDNYGLIYPFISFSGSATATYISGPDPETISQLPPGSSGTFEWKYKINGNPGAYLYAEGYANAYAQGVSTPVCRSNNAEIVRYPMFVYPDNVTSGATNARFLYQFFNGGTINVNRIFIQTNVQYEGTWIYLSGSGSGGYGSCLWTRTEQTNWIRFDSPSASCDIPPGGMGSFYITYSSVPSVNVDTYYAHQGNVNNGGTLLAVTTYNVVVIPYSLTLSKNPAGPIPADGTSRYDIYALLMNGPEPVSGVVISFSTTAGTLTSSATTDENGIAYVQLIAPSSINDITAVVSASYRNAYSSINAPFTGVKTANLQYIGGTLYPLSMAKGGIYSIRADFINAGNLSITLRTSSYVHFSDGLNTYIAYLNEPLTINPDERKTLFFNEAQISQDFSSGIYYPWFYLTDGSIVQERQSFDKITVISRPDIIDINGSPNPGEVYLTFKTETGEYYDILFKDSFSGTFLHADTVYSDGTTYTWVDDGTKTGSIPYSVKERYYEIRHTGTDIPSYGWGGSYCVEVAPNWNLLSLPIIPKNTNIQILIGNQLTGAISEDMADRILKWDPSVQEYTECAWLVDTGGQFPEWDGKWIDCFTYQLSDMEISADTGFWVQNRHNEQNICLAGMVSNEERLIHVGQGWQILGTTYPSGVTINGNTGLIESGASGSISEDMADRILKWDPSVQEYTECAWLVDTGGQFPEWDGKWIDCFTYQLSNMTLSPESGFWYQDRPPAGFTWHYPKPYTIPPNQ